MAINEPRPEARSRRAILAAALGGVAGLVGARFGRPEATAAAAGGPVIMGAANDAGTTNTSLSTSSTGTGFLVTQNGAGTALRGSAVGSGSIAGFFTAQNGTGISGVTGNAGSYGVFAQNNGAAGSGGSVRAAGGSNNGVVATTSGPATIAGTTYALKAVHTNTSAYAMAIYGEAAGDGVGVMGNAVGNGIGVYGSGAATGVLARGSSGVVGEGETNGVLGFGQVDGSFGGRFESPGPTGAGMWSESINGTGVGAIGGETGIYAAAPEAGHAGIFDGDVQVNGTITETAGAARIDHPLDPANQYLSHSFVGSPDMLSVYAGTVTTDGKGVASVALPTYFEALNGDVRYQLTVIGPDFAQAVVSSEVKGGRFSIRTDRPAVKVSWQVTGVRQDAFARDHPIKVEQAKSSVDRGKYIYPQGFGKPMTAQIGRLPRPARPTAR